MILAIVQARLGSSRFPNKILLKLPNGLTVFETIIKTLSGCKRVDEIAVTTPDKEVYDLANSLGASGWHYKGARDVLREYFIVANFWWPEHIVRVTADCPLLTSQIIDEVIKKHLDNKSDYTYNHNDFDTESPNSENGDGYDVEVFTFKALKKAHKEAVEISDREHVTPYIKRNALRTLKVNPPVLCGCSLNTEEDYKKILTILESKEHECSSFRNRGIVDNRP